MLGNYLSVKADCFFHGYLKRCSILRQDDTIMIFFLEAGSYLQIILFIFTSRVSAKEPQMRETERLLVLRSTVPVPSSM